MYVNFCRMLLRGLSITTVVFAESAHIFKQSINVLLHMKDNNPKRVKRVYKSYEKSDATEWPTLPRMLRSTSAQSVSLTRMEWAYVLIALYRMPTSKTRTDVYMSVALQTDLDRIPPDYPETEVSGLVQLDRT